MDIYLKRKELEESSNRNEKEDYLSPLSLGKTPMYNSSNDPEIQLSISERRASIKIQPISLPVNDYQSECEFHSQDKSINSSISPSESIYANQSVFHNASPNKVSVPLKRKYSLNTPRNYTPKGTRSQNFFFGDDTVYQNEQYFYKHHASKRKLSFQGNKCDSGFYSPSNLYSHNNPGYGFLNAESTQDTLDSSLQTSHFELINVQQNQNKLLSFQPHPFYGLEEGNT